jgi:hypothetical protein
MLSETLEALKEQAPIRARVAFALAVGEAVTGTLPSGPAKDPALAALAKGWNWAAGAVARAADMHEHLGAVAEAEAGAEPNRVSALCSLELVICYASWHAYRQELRGDADGWRFVPNEMAEMSEEVLNQLCQYALEAGISEQLVGGLARAALQHGRSGHRDLGPPIRRSDLSMTEP